MDQQFYEYYKSLGYTDDQSYAIASLEFRSLFSRERSDILEAWVHKKKEDSRTFSEFFRYYHDHPNALVEDGYTKQKEQPQSKKDSISVPGFPSPMKKSKTPNGSKPGFLSELFGNLGRTNRAAKKHESRVMKEEEIDYDDEEDSDECTEALYEKSSIAFTSVSSCAMPAQPVMAAPTVAFTNSSLFEVSGVSIENVRTDSYESIEEANMRETAASPTSTFRPTYNTAAAGVLLSNLREHSNIRSSMVRTEELLNYMRYNLLQPKEDMFAFTTEKEEINGKDYLFFGVQGRRIVPRKQNICFLLDTSGSMSGRSAIMACVIFSVLSRMNDGDIFSLVTYSYSDKVVVNGLKLDKTTDIDELIYIMMKEIEISGCTNGSAGIDKAYKIVEKNIIRDGVNRVIILTDGDLNFGIHEKDGLKGLISRKKESGAYFSAIGTGIYNLMDDKLEILAKNGNGNYFVVNSLSDVERSIVKQYEALVFPIAKNVKAQVEFNPMTVKRYKLIGYENRRLNHEDFRNDAVIAEPFGSGSYFIALYEIERADEDGIGNGLKYQTISANNADELATITVRYEDISGDGFHEISGVVPVTISSSNNIRRAVRCALIAEKLREDNADRLNLDKLMRVFAEEEEYE